MQTAAQSRSGTRGAPSGLKKVRRSLALAASASESNRKYDIYNPVECLHVSNVRKIVESREWRKSETT